MWHLYFMSSNWIIIFIRPLIKCRLIQNLQKKKFILFLDMFISFQINKTVMEVEKKSYVRHVSNDAYKTNEKNLETLTALVMWVDSNYTLRQVGAIQRTAGLISALLQISVGLVVVMIREPERSSRAIRWNLVVIEIQSGAAA